MAGSRSFPVTFGSVAILSRQQFDTIEFDAAASGDHAAAASQMYDLAVTGTESAGMSRSEAFLRAGEQWMLADDPAEAIDAFRLALADGGAASADPRVPLARALFQLGREPEARAIVGELKAERPADPRTCDLVAELLVERGELVGALEWATAGVELCLAAGRQRDGQESELTLLLRLRYRIRVDLGLTEDAYDAMLDEA
jgi:hypothetical protein